MRPERAAGTEPGRIADAEGGRIWSGDIAVATLGMISATALIELLSCPAWPGELRGSLLRAGEPSGRSRNRTPIDHADGLIGM
ncbi:hypothetical protein [Nocardia brevicatena]|uniref:hypothetical protein n=1 Tax=Nocardia brevicatena TaxID=37327 RepID=UPI0002FF4829|nr:hypothetical protein [Nocardia brevicatena]